MADLHALPEDETSLPRILRGLTHESRNALQRGLASLEMLLLEVQGQPPLMQLVAEAQGALEDLRALYEETRRYTQPLSLNCQTHDIPTLVQTAWNQLAARRQRPGSRLELNVRSAETRCCVDSSQILAAFSQLLRVALVASPPPALLQVHITPSLSAGLVIAFRDAGPNLTPEQRANLFHPFFNARASGNGLGLAFAQRIVTAHGGSLTLGPDLHPGMEILCHLPQEIPLPIPIADSSRP